MVNVNRRSVSVLAVVGALRGRRISRIEKECGQLTDIQLRFFDGDCSSFPANIDHVIYTRYVRHNAWNARKGIPCTLCHKGTNAICQAIKKFAAGTHPPTAA